MCSGICHCILFQHTPDRSVRTQEHVRTSQKHTVWCSSLQPLYLVLFANVMLSKYTHDVRRQTAKTPKQL